ncbi:DUF6155 family protein [Christiangramia flava]|uniref:Uncharacterized protein n=1 Tax=Christiangramia flava JLT2011 TaxID=1229726 RepID=A0A1L7I9S4_9FLAO|nr:DUF6155 family protein [Christiangramia flava]APU69943.1 hypothetical protein GRFL_3219 [Christiangramia flava JLT2011]OSS39428.1 hypothetical protein C723_1330 [Christiangramia flava JLT2011]
MSKRDFKKYIAELKRKDLQEQLLDMYERFDEVKKYYDFIFNPQEDKLLDQAKFKISKEYFPVNRRKPKMRRSVAQKIIREYSKLEMAPDVLAEIMFYNVEIAQTFARGKDNISSAFEKSMYKSFEQAVSFLIENGILEAYKERIRKITVESHEQKWSNSYQFVSLADHVL